MVHAWQQSWSHRRAALLSSAPGRFLRLPAPRGRRAGRRTRTERAAAAFGGEAEGVVPMEAVSEAYCRLAANRSVGGAVRAAARRGPRALARL